jgi:hypothetical protein
MVKNSGFYFCIVSFEAGNCRTYSSIKCIKQFMSFLYNWYDDWAEVKIHCQVSGEYLEDYHWENYIHQEVEYDIDDFVDPKNCEAWH